MDNYSEFVSDGGVTLSSPRFRYDEGILVSAQNPGDAEVHKLDKTTFAGRHPGYTYWDYDTYNDGGNIISQERVFYYDGMIIPVGDIPKDLFEYMKSVKKGYVRTWEEYVKYNKCGSLSGEIPIYTYLLSSLDIKSREDWERWLLENSQNKNANMLLVGMVNNAVEMRFPL